MNLKYYPKFWLSKLKRTEIATHRYNSIFDIESEFLKLKGIKLLIFDVDDTLTGHLDKIDPDVKVKLKEFESEGFKLALYSNCTKPRHQELKEMFKDFFYYHVELSNKPDPGGYIEVLKHFDVKGEESCMVGDKVATDLYGAFLAGIEFRILVKPFSSIFKTKRANLFLRVMRRLESL